MGTDIGKETMALKRILQNSQLYLQPEDLPWANEYVKSVEDMSTTYLVKAFYVFDSGLMVITPCFKAYIHSGSQLHEYVLEALEVFIQQPTGTIDELVCILLKKGKIDLMTDDERKSAHWMKTENKYTQVYMGGTADENVQKSNPLLAGMGVRGDLSSTKTKQQGSVPETHAKAARKATRTD